MPWNETAITGSIRHRQSFFGKMVLQIAVIETYDEPMRDTPWNGSQRVKWRDAKAYDLTQTIIQAPTAPTAPPIPEVSPITAHVEKECQP